MRLGYFYLFFGEYMLSHQVAQKFFDNPATHMSVGNTLCNAIPLNNEGQRFFNRAYLEQGDESFYDMTGEEQALFILFCGLIEGV
jgi:hypothetical protein